MDKQQNFKMFLSGSLISSSRVVESLYQYCDTDAIFTTEALLEDASYCESIFHMYLTKKTKFIDFHKAVSLFFEFEPEAAPALLLQCLASTREIILENEWYELMSRYEYATRKIAYLFDTTC